MVVEAAVRPAVPVPSAADTVGRALAGAGMAAIWLTVLLIGVLHLLVPESDPVLMMLSDYALGGGRPLFDTAVLALAAGSAAVLVVLVRTGTAGRASAGLLATWCVAMLIVVAFPTCDCRIDTITVEGYVHTIASIVGFLCLPLAALVLGRRWRGDPVWGRRARWAHRLGLLSLAWLLPMVLALVPVASLAVALWSSVPLGLVERGLAVTEIALLLVLGSWARAATRSGPGSPTAVRPATMATCGNT